MKKIILLASVLAMVVSGANADYRKVRTSNCNSAAMHARLEREVHAHRAVITEVVCEETRVVAEPVMVYEPVYEPAYVPAPMEYIPIVDCVPYPTTCEYCANRF